MDPTALAIDVVRASGARLLRGRVTLPTPRLVELARRGLTKATMVESIEIVPGDGEARIHVVVKVMGGATRIVVRAAIASLHLGSHGGALRLRLLEAPTFSTKQAGKSGGLLAMLGAVGEAALGSLGPDRIVQTIAELIGGPLSAKGDLLVVDLGAIPAVAAFVKKQTTVGVVGDLMHVTGAKFLPGGLEIGVKMRPKVAIRAVTARVRGRLFKKGADPAKGIGADSHPRH